METPTPHPDTICAIATPPGIGALAVARVSGPQAIGIVSSRWRGAPLDTMPSHTAHLGCVTDSRGQLLDQVVLTLFRGPRSFTGEDVVELSCHGSPCVQQQLLATLVDAGCRMATGGEFTRRAVAAGRMDLSQAEAVADVIAAQTSASLRVALNQMRGGLSAELAALRDRLLRFVSLMELELDFSEEDVEFADRRQLIALAREIDLKISRLTESFGLGNAIRTGVPVAIVGQTNAGKSTLLNALLRDDRALVSDIHGTTRDVIEDTITLGGVLFRLMDTAGIRQSADTVEAMGIERSFGKLDQAQLVLWVIDGTSPPELVRETGERILGHCAGKHVIAALNKADLGDVAPIRRMLAAMLPAEADVLTMSALDEADVLRLERLIVAAAGLPQVDDDTVVVTNVRHYQALRHAGEALRRAQDGLQSGLPGDLVSQDIRDCIHHLGTITGQITTHEILGEIFKNFCVGK